MPLQQKKKAATGAPKSKTKQHGKRKEGVPKNRKITFMVPPTPLSESDVSTSFSMESEPRKKSNELEQKDVEKFRTCLNFRTKLNINKEAETNVPTELIELSIDSSGSKDNRTTGPTSERTGDKQQNREWDQEQKTVKNSKVKQKETATDKNEEKKQQSPIDNSEVTKITIKT